MRRRLLWVCCAALLAAPALLLSDSSPAAAAAQDQKPGFLKVYAPPGATLLVDGVRTRQSDEVRLFQTPPLAVGKKYAYTLKVTFTRDGQPVEYETTAQVRPGEETVVDLRQPPAEGPAPKPEPEPRPAPEPEAKPEVKPEPEPKAQAQPEPRPVAKEPEKEKEPTIVVPYVPTPQKVVEEMLKLANVKEGDVVYDLGCGDGRIVITAVKKYGAKKGYGVDLNPVRVKESKENAEKAQVADKVTFEQGDVLKIKDVSEANVVTLYLLPEVNRRLAPMLKKSLKPGARIVSHDFDMGDWKPDKTVDVTDEDGIEHTIYLWTIPEKK
ncbi:MAG TPA: TIGR03000 domain-containing protein [Gemmataceae bacterium]